MKDPHRLGAAALVLIAACSSARGIGDAGGAGDAGLTPGDRKSVV